MEGQRQSIQMLQILADHSLECEAGCKEWCSTDNNDAALCPDGLRLLEIANQFAHDEKVRQVTSMPLEVVEEMSVNEVMTAAVGR